MTFVLATCNEHGVRLQASGGECCAGSAPLTPDEVPLWPVPASPEDEEDAA